MKPARRVRRRSALAALEVVMVTGLCLPMAVFVFYAVEQAMQNYYFFVGNAYGSPLM